MTVLACPMVTVHGCDEAPTSLSFSLSCSHSLPLSPSLSLSLLFLHPDLYFVGVPFHRWVGCLMCRPVDSSLTLCIWHLCTHVYLVHYSANHTMIHSWMVLLYVPSFWNKTNKHKITCFGVFRLNLCQIQYVRLESTGRHIKHCTTIIRFPPYQKHQTLERQISVHICHRKLKLFV